jgi:hypothetical protein
MRRPPSGSRADRRPVCPPRSPTDRLGRKKLFPTILTLFLAAMVATAFSLNPTWFFVGSSKRLRWRTTGPAL